MKNYNEAILNDLKEEVSGYFNQIIQEPNGLEIWESILSEDFDDNLSDIAKKHNITIDNDPELYFNMATIDNINLGRISLGNGDVDAISGANIISEINIYSKQLATEYKTRNNSNRNKRSLEHDLETDITVQKANIMTDLDSKEIPSSSILKREISPKKRSKLADSPLNKQLTEEEERTISSLNMALKTTNLESQETFSRKDLLSIIKAVYKQQEITESQNSVSQLQAPPSLGNRSTSI